MDTFDKSCRNAADHTVRRHIPGYDRACRHDRVITDRYPRCDNGIRADPDTLADHDRRRMQLLPFCRIHIMVQGRQHHAVAD